MAKKAILKDLLGTTNPMHFLFDNINLLCHKGNKLKQKQKKLKSLSQEYFSIPSERYSGFILCQHLLTKQGLQSYPALVQMMNKL